MCSAVSVVADDVGGWCDLNTFSWEEMEQFYYTSKTHMTNVSTSYYKCHEEGLTLDWSQQIRG